VEAADITKLDSRSSASGFTIALSRSAAAIPHLVETLQAAASELTVIDDAPPEGFDAHVVIATEVPLPLPNGSGVRIIVTDIDESKVRDAMRVGADAVMSPDISVEDARTVLSAAIGGYYPVPRRLTPAIATRLEDPRPQMLSDRYRTILAYLAGGRTMIELAQELGCSERHARRQVRSLWNTMGVHGRAQGLVAAARRGFLEDLNRDSD